MALLGMTDTRIGSILAEMVRVQRHRMSRGGQRDRAGILGRWGGASHLAVAMATLLTRQAPMVMKGW